MAKKIVLVCVTILLSIFSLTNSSSAAILWSEDWEGNPSDDWYAENGTWEVGVPTSGPGSAYNSENCAATILDGNYPAGTSTRLIRIDPFTVPAAGQSPRLRFWHWYSFSTYSSGQVQIKVDGGSWETISPNYTGTGGGIWTRPYIDLSPYASQSVQIAFLFSSGQYGGTGWYIDDVAVITGVVVFNNPEDWESGLGYWYAENGTWEVGVPASGPGSAYSPENCAATVLGGNYLAGTSSRLISPPFVVADAGEGPNLRFQHWYSFSTYSSGRVQIKVDGGSWETISPTYTGTSGGIWTNPYIDLSPYASQSVQIAFLFTSGQYGGTGWYIDDVEIQPIDGPKFKIDIKVNGSGGPLVIPPSKNVLVTVELEDGIYTDLDVDWWIGAVSTIGTYWYNSSGNWQLSNTPVLYSQDPLHDLPEITVLDKQLPVGIYTFFFVIDDTPDGIFGITARDHVNVFVKRP